MRPHSLDPALLKGEIVFQKWIISNVLLQWVLPRRRINPKAQGVFEGRQRVNRRLCLFRQCAADGGGGKAAHVRHLLY